MNHSTEFEVIILGGSYAGLSAAMALGRSLRRVLIIDNQKPCNAQTPHSHNFITHDGKQPHVIASEALGQVLQYPTVELFEGTVVKAERSSFGFSVTTQGGKIFSAVKLLFATGLKDQFPAIKGFAECWGISVLHCPYCHGYEIRGQRLGVLANGEMGYEFSKLIKNLTNDLTLFTNGKALLTESQLEKLKHHNIAIVEKEIASFEHEGGEINKIVFTDGSEANLLALFAKVPFTQHLSVPVELGCTLTEQGLIKVDELQRTTCEGVYAAGDNCSMRAVSVAIASGTKAGAAINKDLVDQTF